MADQADHPDDACRSYELSVSLPPPVHVLNERILIAQIQNMFALYMGPYSLRADLLFWLISFKLRSSSAYSEGK